MVKDEAERSAKDIERRLTWVNHCPNKRSTSKRSGGSHKRSRRVNA